MNCNDLFHILVTVYSLEFLQTLTMDATKFHQLTYTQHVNQIEHPGPLPLFDLILHLLPLLFKRHDDSGNFYVSTETKAENSLSLLDLLSSPWTHLLHPDHQEVPLILLLTFCLSCITKLLFLDCSPFCAVSWIPLVSDCLLIYTWPVTLWHLPCSHLNNLLPTFLPLFCFFFILWNGCKSFYMSSQSLACDMLSCPSINVFKAFPGFLQVRLFKILLSFNFNFMYMLIWS